MGNTLDTLETVLDQVQTQKHAMQIARARRDEVRSAGKKLPGVLESYISGSLATNLMIRPVTDGDCGIVLDRRSYPDLGPEGGGVGPLDVVETVVTLIKHELRTRYPHLEAKAMKRGVLVTFNEPLDEDQDPTVDLVIALNRKNDDALWIPKIDWNERDVSWSPGHPKKHVDMLNSGTEDLKRDRRRAIRIAKAWKNQFDSAGICSFNLAALALECLTFPMPLDEAMLRFYEYGAQALAQTETDDPAHVSGPISIKDPGHLVVAQRFEAAGRGLRTALASDNDADAVATALTEVFPDYVKPPTASTPKSSIAQALRDKTAVGLGTGSALVAGPTVTVAAKSVRAYGNDATPR